MITAADFSPFISFVLNHLWQSTLFAVVAWVLCRTALRENRPRVRYGVWLAASVKFLVPFAALIELGRRLAWPREVPVGSMPQWMVVVDQVTRNSGAAP